MTVKNPKSGLGYDDLNTRLYNAEREGRGDRLWVGNHTYVEWIVDPEDQGDGDIGFIAMTFHDTKVVNFLDENTVQLFDGGFRTTATGRRLDWALLPLGFRLVTNNAGEGRVRWGQNTKFKVYSISTGAYRDYTPGMIVERGAF